MTARVGEDEARSVFAGRQHARYIRPDVPYHVISRVFQGRHLLRPCAALNRIIIGVLGRGLYLYPQVRLYAYAFMSNHMHLALQAPADQMAAFVGFVKREISRRWGGHPACRWPGTMWHEYLATALPTPESQLACFEYILSQGVKEGLVARSELWPGVHCARQVLAGAAIRGEWFDATSYSRAHDASTRSTRPTTVRRADYYRSYEVALAVLPVWSKLSDAQRRDRARELLDRIEALGRRARGDRPPLGAKRIIRTPLERRTDLPQVPWFQRRRRMICWADGREPQAREYIAAHWQFQRAYRAASIRFREEDTGIEFPEWAFLPRLIRVARGTESPPA